MGERELYYADAMGFLAPPGQPIIADPELKFLDLVHVTVAPPISADQATLVKMVQKSVAEIRTQPTRLEIVRDAIIVIHKPKDMTAVVMGLQNSPTDYKYDDLFDLGVRVVQLAYQDEHEICGGFGYQLMHITDRCRRVLDDLARIGMILDLSHLGHISAMEVLDHIEKEKLHLRVCISHTGSYRFYSHPRNMLDDVMVRVAALDGVVGVYGLTFGLDWVDNSMVPMARHANHFVEICGGDKVVIGSDGTYQSVPEEVYRARCEDMRKRLDQYGIFNVRYPNNVEGTETPDKLRVILNGLLAHGHMDEEVCNKIIGTNLRQFFISALPQKGVL